ncbi:MAG: UDP-N-acetylglucosamine 2-epimerase, partial [Pirellulales bacterium]
EESGLQHLREEGKRESSMFHVGHVMIDNLLFEMRRLDREPAAGAEAASLTPGDGKFGVVTLHRASNVDDPTTLAEIMRALGRVAKTIPLIFPVHPRTKSALARYRINTPPGISFTEPQGYREFLRLWRDATLVLTDSGGLQEETTALGIPCLTLRENTERPITITEGTNMLVGTQYECIVAAAEKVLTQKALKDKPVRPPLWDGRASERILEVLATNLSDTGC